MTAVCTEAGLTMMRATASSPVKTRSTEINGTCPALLEGGTQDTDAGKMRLHSPTWYWEGNLCETHKKSSWKSECWEFRSRHKTQGLWNSMQKLQTPLNMHHVESFLQCIFEKMENHNTGC